MHALSQLTRLTFLGLAQLAVSDDCAAHMRALTRLRHLDCHAAHGLSDNGLLCMEPAVAGLTYLDVAWTGVTLLPLLPCLQVGWGGWLGRTGGSEGWGRRVGSGWGVRGGGGGMQRKRRVGGWGVGRFKWLMGDARKRLGACCNSAAEVRRGRGNGGDNVAKTLCLCSWR